MLANAERVVGTDFRGARQTAADHFLALADGVPVGYVDCGTFDRCAVYGGEGQPSWSAARPASRSQCDTAGISTRSRCARPRRARCHTRQPGRSVSRGTAPALRPRSSQPGAVGDDPLRRAARAGPAAVGGTRPYWGTRRNTAPRSVRPGWPPDRTYHRIITKPAGMDRQPKLDDHPASSYG